MLLFLILFSFPKSLSRIPELLVGYTEGDLSSQGHRQLTLYEDKPDRRKHLKQETQMQSYDQSYWSTPASGLKIQDLQIEFQPVKYSEHIILLQAVCRFCTIRDCCDLSTHCGSCLVPKLNWQMHCNYKFYLLLWNCKGLHIKGKVNMLKADKISAGCQHLLKLFTFREQSSDNRRPVAFPAYLLVS